MAIRKSAAAGIDDLIGALASADAVVREAAAARLGAIGERAVPHLVDAFAATPSAIARAGILNILELTRDRRGLVLALGVLDSRDHEPGVTAAAIALLGSCLDDDEQTLALETLGGVAVDTDRPDLERLAAWQVLERMPERILAPLRKRLARDRSAAVRRMAAAPRRQPAGSAASLDPGDVLAASAAGERVDPLILTEAVAVAGGDVPLTLLHSLVERTRDREAQARAEADQAEWRRARGAVHMALARRGSRVAAYDLQETFRAAARPVPEDFVAAAALIGDAACLEALADALARLGPPVDRQKQEWRDRLIATGRAIIKRERLTRRHAAVQRIVRRRPDVAHALLA